MAFQKYLEKTMPVTHLKWDKLNPKQEISDEENKLRKTQLQLATTNILKDIDESIVHILNFTKELRNQTKSKIILRENCNVIKYFCQCMERLLLFGFKKIGYIRSYGVWSFLSDSTSKCFANCQQLENDINLIKSIDILNDIGRLRAFLLQSFRSKSISFYFELISQQTDIIHVYYTEFSIMKQKHKLNTLLIQLNKLNYLPENIEFHMLLNDISLNITEYFKADTYGIPQWIIQQNKSVDIDIDIQKKKKKKKRKNKQKSKRTLYSIRSTDDTVVQNIDDQKINQKQKPLKIHKKKHKGKENKTYTKKKVKRRNDKQFQKPKINKCSKSKSKSKSTPPSTMNIIDGIRKPRSSSVGKLIKNNSNPAPLAIISAKQNNLQLEIKSISVNNDEKLNSKREFENKKEIYALKNDLNIKDESIKLLRSELDKIKLERNHFKQQSKQQQNEICNLRSNILILRDKLMKTNQLLRTKKHKEEDKKKEHDDVNWRNIVQINDRVDYKLEFNVWTSAIIIGYILNDENRLKIRFDGWNLIMKKLQSLKS